MRFAQISALVFTALLGCSKGGGGGGSSPVSPPPSTTPTPQPQSGTGTPTPLVIPSPFAGIWIAPSRLGTEVCTQVIHFQAGDHLSMHMLCSQAQRDHFAVESRSFQLKSSDGKVLTYTLKSSSCGEPTSDIKLEPRVTQNSKGASIMTFGLGVSTQFEKGSEKDAAVDLNTLNTAHGLPIKHGCFENGSMASFKVQGARS